MKTIFAILFPIPPNSSPCLLALLLFSSASLKAELLFYTSPQNTITISGSNPKASGFLLIPSTINNLPVTAIDDGAFYECTGLTSVTLPNSLTSIGGWAFEGCTGLTSVTLPSSITSIGYQAFRGCTGLTSVTLPSSLTTIGDAAFQGCTGLTSVTLPSSITAIGYGTFEGCTGLTSVTLPSSITAIGQEAFSGCTGLTSVTLPSSITAIGDYAFYGCTGLKAITVDIANSTYSSNDGILFNKAQTSLIAFPAGKIGAYTIPNSVTSIGDGAFDGCTGLTSVTLPSSLTKIGYQAFYGCTGLTSVTLPSSITAIGTQAFYGCTGLKAITVDIANSTYSSNDGILFNKAQTSLIAFPAGKIGAYTIPNSITEIGYYAFYGCTGLTSVTLPSSITKIGKAAFYGCSGLTSVYFMGNAPSVGSDVFYNANKSTVYYIKGKTGWSSSFAGRPTATFIPTTPIPPTITVQPLPLTVTAGSPASFTVTAAGTAPLSYQWAKDSVNIAKATNQTFSLAAATTADAGLYQLTVSNALGSVVSLTARLTVNPILTPVITSAAIATATVGQLFSYTITANNTPTSFYATGLPAGLTVNTATGLISGTPTIASTITLTISASNLGGTGNQSLTLTVNPLTPVITSATTATATVDLPFRYIITAINTPTRFDAAPLPAGFSFDLLTGEISGTPTTAGTITITLSAVNAFGTGTQSLTLTVNLAPIITLKYERARSGFVLEVQDGATVTHTIEYSTDLKLWTPLETQAVGSTDLTLIDPQATTSRHRFYRVIKQ